MSGQGDYRILFGRGTKLTVEASKLNMLNILAATADKMSSSLTAFWCKIQDERLLHEPVCTVVNSYGYYVIS